MTKSEIVEKVAAAAGITKKDSDVAVNTVFEAIGDALAAGDKVQIAGFGGFEPKNRPARTGINPATKEKISIAATTVPVFKAGKALKEKVAK